LLLPALGGEELAQSSERDGPGFDPAAMEDDSPLSAPTPPSNAPAITADLFFEDFFFEGSFF
jgi:hypothetical protein